MTTVLAWHNDPALKERIVARMRQHREADAFTRGLYQHHDAELPLGYRGCAIGCLLDKQDGYSDGESRTPKHGWHAEVQTELGIAEGVAGIIDEAFESFDRTDAGHQAASDFAVAVVEAIPVGADLAVVEERYDAWVENLGHESWDLGGGVMAAKLFELIQAAPVVQPVCDCESYEPCAGECCGVGNCTCTPAATS